MARLLLFTRVKMRWFHALVPYKASEAVFSQLFPLFLINVLHYQAGTVGLLTALVSLTAVPGSMIWGALSDALHRRRMFLVLGCAGSGLCLIGMAVSQNMGQMVVLCLLYGAFSVALAPIPSILIMETMPRDHWEEALGTFNKIGGWGWVVGLAVGAVLLPGLQYYLPLTLSMQLIFLSLGALAGISAWWMYRTVPEAIHRVSRHHYLAATGRLPRLPVVERVLYLPRHLLFILHPKDLWCPGTFLQRALGRYWLITILIMGGTTLAFTPMPLFMQMTLHLDGWLIFAFALVRMLASTLCYEWAGHWGHRVGPKGPQLWAFGGRSVAFLGLAGLWLLPYPPFMLLGLLGVNILSGVTWSLIAISGPVLVRHLAATQQPGQAMGTYNAVQGLSRIGGALLSGYLVTGIGYYGLFALTGLLMLLAVVLLATMDLPQAPPDDMRSKEPDLKVA